MDRYPFDGERDALVAKVAQQLVDDWSMRLLARDKRAESDLQNTVLDHLSGDDAKALFIKAAVGIAVADVLFASMVAEAMYAVCKAEAAKTVDAMEQRRIESRNDNRIAQAAFGRALH